MFTESKTFGDFNTGTQIDVFTYLEKFGHLSKDFAFGQKAASWLLAFLDGPLVLLIGVQNL